LIQPALAEIGVGWHEGRVTVQQEHFASALAMRRLEALLALTPAPTRRGRILVGCPPHEQHTFVPLMLSVLLRRRGWDVVYLGADVPLLSLEQTIEVARPTLVILTAQQLYTAASLLDMGNLLAEKRVPMAYGGLVFNSMPHLEQVIPGHFLGTQLDLAVDAIEAIMATPRVRAAARDVPPESEKVLRLFRYNRAQIEADIWQAFEHSGLSQMSMADANAAFGRSLESALALGMLEPYAAGIEWLADLLVMHYQLPASLISEYCRVYCQSVVRHMGAEGQILAVWLEDLAQSAETGNKPEIGAVRHRHSGVYTMRRG